MSTMETYGDKAVDVLEKSIARSKAQGSKGVSAKHLPGSLVQKAIKKAAPIMRDAIADIKQDPGFSKLQPETQTKIQEILATFDKAEEDDEKISQSDNGEREERESQAE